MKVIKTALVLLNFISLPTLAIFAARPYPLETEEYAVCATIIDAWYSANIQQTVVIRARTAMFTNPQEWDIELAYVQKKIPQLTPEIAHDFQAKNMRTYPLHESVSGKAYVVLDDNDIDALFKERRDWSSFYARYPDASGLITVSRVGFNHAKTQALACIVNQWDRFTGAAEYAFLEKSSDQTWVVVGQARVWNSWFINRIRD